HNPDQREWAVRGTLKWEPTDAFDARLKLNYSELKGNGPAALTAFISCPDGARQTFSGIDQCKAGGKNVNAGYGSVIGNGNYAGTLNFFREDGSNFIKQTQFLGGLEMNYHVSDEITITSVTG